MKVSWHVYPEGIRLSAPTDFLLLSPLEKQLLAAQLGYSAWRTLSASNTAVEVLDTRALEEPK
jgi:hypothetical protein